MIIITDMRRDIGQDSILLANVKVGALLLIWWCQNICTFWALKLHKYMNNDMLIGVHNLSLLYNLYDIIVIFQTYIQFGYLLC